MLSDALGHLKHFQRFILYKTAPRAGSDKLDKVPVDFSGVTASAHDPQQWLSYENAQAIKSTIFSGDGYGTGFVLTPDTKVFCLDIDGALMPNGQWSPLAQEVCAMLPGAAVEVSISGKGLHIWGTYTGDEPAHAKRAAANGELYTSGRFIALGNQSTAVGNAGTDCTVGLSHLIAAHFPPGAHAGVAQEWTEGPCEGNPPADDGELLSKAMRPSAADAFNHDKVSFRDLWEANAAKLGVRWPDAGGRAYDASAADAALAQRLAFFTGRDCQRIDRIMRRPDCGLYREKYERPDYLQRTIMGAVARQESVYGDNRTLADNRTPAATSAAGAAYVPAATVADMAAIVAENPNKDEAVQLMMQLGTQDSIAGAFATLYAGKLKFDHSRKKWHIWDGTRWREDDKKRAFDLVVNLCRDKNREGKSSMGSASFAHGVEDVASSRPSLAVSGSEWNSDNYLLNTPAGTIDLSTGKLRQPNPEDMITKCTAASPDAASDGAAFRRFMMEITNNDEELIRFHQVSLGACLSGAVEGHWLLFWYGVPRAGKNTLGELVEALMGDYARTIPASTLMSKKFEGHPTEMANLQGIRLATSSELSDGDHWNEARIKQLTGDATLSARWIGGNFFEFERNFKLLVYGNYKPQLRSADEALRARLKIVPFKVSFLDREDADLPRRLRAEMGYVLQWLIDGHQQWLAAGKKLPRCAAVDAEISQYFEGQSTPQLWLKECCEIVEKDERPDLQLHSVGELYRSYKNWKEARGESPLSQTRWQPEAFHGFATVRTRKGACVRRLRLQLPFGAPRTEPLAVPSSDFETFAAELLGKGTGNYII
jgi:putative DNA primase/helicase